MPLFVFPGGTTAPTTMATSAKIIAYSASV
jgi:hypothetical protein